MVCPVCLDLFRGSCCVLIVINVSIVCTFPGERLDAGRDAVNESIHDDVGCGEGNKVDQFGCGFCKGLGGGARFEPFVDPFVCTEDQFQDEVWVASYMSIDFTVMA